MAPLELYYGTVANDGDGHNFYVNSKQKLPLIIKPGKRIKKEYKDGNTTLSIEASCDKSDLGGTVHAECKVVTGTEPAPNPIWQIQHFRRTVASSPVGLGRSVYTDFDDNKNSRVGFRAVHKTNNSK